MVDQSGMGFVSERTKGKRKAAQDAAEEKGRKAKTAGPGRRTTVAKRAGQASAKASKKTAALKTPSQKSVVQKPKHGTARNPAGAKTEKAKSPAKAAMTNKSSAAKASPAKPRKAGPSKIEVQSPAAAEPLGGVEPLASPVASDIVLPRPDEVLPETASRVAEDLPTSQAASRQAGSAEIDTEAQRKTGLLATNAVHATRRRLKRSWHQNKPLLAIGAAVVLGVLILAERSEPPEVLPMERVSAARTAPSVAASPPALPTWVDPVDDPVRATELGLATPIQPQIPSAEPLAADELLEMERMLARLNLEPSRVDGVIDLETKSAIRLYQQIAGLPIDGRPSSALLADMREVVRLLEGTE